MSPFLETRDQIGYNKIFCWVVFYTDCQHDPEIYYNSLRTLHIIDASGMDFRSMLKKKKYAKWGNDDGGPDWGDLKHNEKEEEPCLKKAPEVGIKPVYLESSNV